MISFLAIFIFLVNVINYFNTSYNSDVFYNNEELLYEVKYSVFKIGTIRVTTYNKITENGKNFYECKGFIDSYDGLPFVDLHSIYYSKISEDMHSCQFIGLDKYKGEWWFTKYDIDYLKNQIYIQKGLKNGWKINFEDKMQINSPIQDGLSLFFFARANSGKDKSHDVPTFLNEQLTMTTIDFTSRSEPAKIVNCDYEIDCVKLSGLARFKGIFGLTGDFEGQFSKDQAGIPIKAKLKVIIGNIYVELKNWKRNDWNPPQNKR